MHTVFTLQSVPISDPQASDNYKEKMETPPDVILIPPDDGGGSPKFRDKFPDDCPLSRPPECQPELGQLTDTVREERDRVQTLCSIPGAAHNYDDGHTPSFSDSLTKVPMPLNIMVPDKMFGQEPAQVQCSNCHQMASTRVESSVSSEGWMFACCCCLFGSWITSLLVLTMCVTQYMSP